MKLEAIRKHWEEEGKRFPTKGKITPTSRDPYLALLEREKIIRHLKSSYSALELGCGDAFHTVHYAKHVRKITGIDIAESLISIARKRATSQSMRNIDFVVGSALDIKKIFQTRQFDCIISQRCLINLPEWKHQRDVILQVHDLLKRDGLFVLTEGFQKEVCNLNEIRRRLGLPEIKVVDYNKNMVREDFERFARKHFDVVEVLHHGTYLFLSRIYHPLVVLPNKPKHDSRLNRIAMQIDRSVQIAELEKYSYNLFYALRRK